MNKHNSVPNIRFKGFEDEWEDTGIGKLVKVYDGVHQTPTYKNNGVPFVSVENISNLYTNKFISKSDFENNFKNSKPTSGDLLMTRIGDIGTVNLVKNDNDLAYYVSLALLKPKIKDRKKYINSYFLMYLIESPRTKKELWKRTLHIAFPKKINKNEISKVNLCICLNWKEQQKIGDFFSRLDKLLDLQQQKIDKLELLKKALLQKLFPKHDAKLPELRFKGCNGEWKSMKIGSLFDHKSGTSIEKYFNSDGKYKVISIGSYGKNSKYIDQGIRVNLNSVTKSHLVDKNDLTMVLNDKTPDGQIIGRVLLINKSNEFVINQRTERLIPRNINSKFAFTYLNGPIRKSIKKMVQGGTQIYINYSSIEKIDVLVPKTIEEEQKIGNLLSKVDQLIELENQKLQNFQQVKKCLLQNMFVD